MQFTVYHNPNKSVVYPFLLDVQSDIIDDLDKRMMIPLSPVEKFSGKWPERIMPIIHLIDGNDYFAIVIEMVGVPKRGIGGEFCTAMSYRNEVKAAIDFMLDGI
ncbi:CcdB family protein [Pseudescherichia vulneris]